MSSRPETTSAAAPPVEGSLVGKRVQKYEIVRSIGRGGMGMVYEAINTSIGKRVAMKFVDADLAQNKDAVARFHREAQAASAVESAHIIEIFDAGFTDDDIPFLVMELLRGEDLGHRIKRCGRVELGEALHVTAQILRGLHRAHEAGIVHRDLKPDNIFLVDRDDDPNFAKIVDFGISKIQRGGGVPAHTLTRQGTVLGTPFYMSPEQAQALPDVDGRTDLWAVGAILYECLTGHPPHSGNTYEQVIVNICMKDAADVREDNPAVPEPIARVIAKALTRDRNERFQSSREFLDALVAAGGGLIATRPGRASIDDAATSSPSFPGLTGRTPVRLGSGDGALGLNPTFDANARGSKAGWSTSGGAWSTSTRRWTLGAAMALSLALGIGVAMLNSDHPHSTAPGPGSPEIAVELRANTSDARFSVDGVGLTDRVLRGRRGETKRVRVEALGFTPVDREVTLGPESGPIEVTLNPLTASVTPAVAATPPAEAAASAATEPPLAARAPQAPPRSPTPAASTRPKPTPKTTLTPKPAPTSTGIASGLQLKVD